MKLTLLCMAWKVNVSAQICAYIYIYQFIQYMKITFSHENKICVISGIKFGL